jgi:hypothetical protein
VQRHRVGRHDVRSVEEPGDAPEALRLALREIAVPRTVEAGEAGVLVGLDADYCMQRKGFRKVGDRQRVFGYRKWHFPAVDRNRQGFQLIAIEYQRLCGKRRVAAHRQRRADGCAGASDI